MSSPQGMNSVRRAPRGLPGWVSAILVVLILAGGVGVAVALVKTRDTPQKEPEEVVAPMVEVGAVSVGDRPVSMQLTGEVTAAKKIVVIPEIGGRVVWQHEQLVPGGMLKKGQPILRIDGRDYALALEQQQAQLANQELALKVEKGRGKIAEREWELFQREREQAGVPAANEDPDNEDPLALRQPHLDSAKVAVQSAKSSVSRAKLALTKATITAPFNAFVQMENVDDGQLVGPTSQLATLVGTDAFWVMVSIPIDKLDFVKLPRGDELGSPAKVWVETGRGRIERVGTVIRLLGDLDRVGRMARLLVEIRDPFGLKASMDGKEDETATQQSSIPLLLGSFVRVEIDGVELSGVAEVPRRAMQESDTVYVLDSDNQLRIKRVEVVWGGEDTVLVRGPLQNGDRLVLSVLATPVEGMKLRVHEPTTTEAKAP